MASVPRVSPDQAERIALEHYGVSGKAERLAAEHDDTGPVAMDVAVAACYQLGTGPDVLAPAIDVVAGYHAADPLGPADLALVAEFIVARVAARIIVSQWNALREPANRGYLLRRTPQAVEHFAALREHSVDEIARFLAGCSEVNQ